MRSFLVLILLSAFFMIALAGNYGCANIVPPAGGPRDTLPPVLLDANPNDSSVNFSGNRITLVFDEFVDLKDVQNNFLFTPIFDINPLVTVRQRTVTVRFRDTLDANTTYTLNFGDAIVDINESNVLKDFVYTFSTGPVLDSLEFSGKVLLAETGKIDSTLIVVLHTNLADTAVKNFNPRYVSRLDGAGNFRFSNLAPGRYAVYALGEAGSMRRYQNTKNLFAFADEPIVVSDSTAPVTLYAYRETPEAPPTGGPTATGNRGDNRLRLTTNVSGDRLDLLGDLVLNFNVPLRMFDSTRVGLSTDSTFAPASFTSTLDSSGKILRLKSDWKPGTPYNLVLDREFAADTAGRQLLKTDTLNFTTRQLGDYGKLNIRFRNLDVSRNPVLLFVSNDVVVQSIPINGNSISRNLFPPGDYVLRILYDTNGNGKWDAGKFFGTRRQPELVAPVERRITVKAAWDNDFDIVL